MASKLITPPTALCISLADAKQACRFDDAALDGTITRYIATATRVYEHQTGVSLMPQTWECTLDAFPGGGIELTRTPVAAIVSIVYADGAGTLQTLASGEYSLDNADQYGPAYAVPSYASSWPATRGEINAVRVRYIAGFANAAAVPAHHIDGVLVNVARLIDDPDCMYERIAEIDRVYYV